MADPRRGREASRRAVRRRRQARESPMNISQHQGVDAIELRLTGRLDATWAEHVSESIDAVVRAGSHRIVLNLAGVNYISSLGLAVLMKHYKRLMAVNGSLRICDAGPPILRVLDAAGLAGYL